MNFEKWRIQFDCLLASHHYYQRVNRVAVSMIMLGEYVRLLQLSLVIVGCSEGWVACPHPRAILIVYAPWASYSLGTGNCVAACQ